MKISLALVLAAAIVSGAAPAQTESSTPAHELLLFTQHSGFTEPHRAAHRIVSAEYYVTVGPELKLFGTGGLSRRFGENDLSAGLGAYFRLDSSQMVYGSLTVGFSPVVIPRTDLHIEYTRLLAQRLAGLLGYRTASFTGETVHMLIPGMTLYQLERWTFTSKVFLARLASEATLRGTLFLHVTFDLTDRLMPELYYAVGSESYRANALDYLAGQHSWGITAGAKVRISERLRLRAHYQHVVRTGAFEENAVDAALSFLW